MKVIKVLRNLGIMILATIVLWLGIAMLVYSPLYVYRTIFWQSSDSFDWQKFPNHPLTASADPYHFTEAPDSRVEEIFEEMTGAEDWNRFLEEKDTQAFIVIQDGTVVYEKYFSGTHRDSIVTSFSVAKSFTSALKGTVHLCIASEEPGHCSQRDRIRHPFGGVVQLIL